MNIKIGVTFHKPYEICDEIKDQNIYTYIHAGRQIYKGNDNFLLSIQGDNEGKNISKYNWYINQCTSLYWMYHNMPLIYDYYGHFQYHRFLQYNISDLNQNVILVSDFLYNPYINLNVFHFFYYDKGHQDLLMQFFYNYIDKNQEQKDLLLTFLNNESDFSRLNMFIMPKNIWLDYGKWLTNTIELVKPLIDKNIYLCQDKRYYGYLMQLMIGYYLYKKSKQNIILHKCKTIMYMH